MISSLFTSRSLYINGLHGCGWLIILHLDYLVTPLKFRHILHHFQNYILTIKFVINQQFHSCLSLIKPNLVMSILVSCALTNLKQFSCWNFDALVIFSFLQKSFLSAFRKNYNGIVVQPRKAKKIEVIKFLNGFE